MRYIYVSDEFTIVTGLPEIENGIEINCFDLAVNYEMLRTLNFIDLYARDNCKSRGKEFAIMFFCHYLGQMSSNNSEEHLKTNPKLQILFGYNSPIFEKLKKLV